MRARYYDPVTGRFASEDPARDGVNWFVYCANDPVNKADENGQNALSLFLGDFLRTFLGNWIGNEGLRVIFGVPLSLTTILQIASLVKLWYEIDNRCLSLKNQLGYAEFMLNFGPDPHFQLMAADIRRAIFATNCARVVVAMTICYQIGILIFDCWLNQE